METQHDAVLNIDNPGTKLTNRNNQSKIDTKQTTLLTTFNLRQRLLLSQTLTPGITRFLFTICLKVLCCCNCCCKHDRSGM